MNNFTGIEIPECPVCFEVFSAQVYICKSGHSICIQCLALLQPRICPHCRSDNFNRNREVEALILKINPVKTCGNKNNGCNWVMKEQETVNKHMEECQYRIIDCPQAAVFDSCTWKGCVQDMMTHCQKSHANMCKIQTNKDTVLRYSILDEDGLSAYIFSFENKIFILTNKISIHQKLAYWAVQYVGSKDTAQEYIYEFYITSQLDKKIKYVFTESCHCDGLKADEVFKLNQCAMVPLDILKLYLRENQLTIKIIIRKLGVQQPKSIKRDKLNEGPCLDQRKRN